MAGDPKGVDRRLHKLDGGLKAVGAYLVAQAHTAFDERKLGDIKWPTRYPGQPEPFLNIAAALGDLKTGSVKPRRTKREPVLRDTQTMFRSISFALPTPSRVRAGVLSGPAKEYAHKHQHGKTDTIPVTEAMRENLAKQKKRLQGQASRGKKKGDFGAKLIGMAMFDPDEKAKQRAEQREKRQQAGQKASLFLDALKKVEFIFGANSYRVSINRRPFMGITDRAQTEIPQIIKEFLEG